MTKENLSELKSLISRFNAENAIYGTSYTIIEERQYSVGCYSLTVCFDDLMYSLDVAKLFK